MRNICQQPSYGGQAYSGDWSRNGATSVAATPAISRPRSCGWIPAISSSITTASGLIATARHSENAERHQRLSAASTADTIMSAVIGNVDCPLRELDQA